MARGSGVPSLPTTPGLCPHLSLVAVSVAVVTAVATLWCPSVCVAALLRARGAPGSARGSVSMAALSESLWTAGTHQWSSARGKSTLTLEWGSHSNGENKIPPALLTQA